MNTLEKVVSEARRRVIELNEVSDICDMKQLKRIAAEYEIEGRSKMLKQELIEAINIAVNEKFEKFTDEKILTKWFSYGGKFKKLL